MAVGNSRTGMQMEPSRLVDDYGRFEQRVRRWTENLCRPLCSHCRSVCCRAHFCDETRQSAFLTLVASRYSRSSDYLRGHGWLSSTGCTLVAGRPPVCYEFLCSDISAAVATDPIRRQALLAASLLITFVGRRAIGGRHLVTATRASDLKRIRPARFLARLEEAQHALQAAMDVFAGRSPDAPMETLFRRVISA